MVFASWVVGLLGGDADTSRNAVGCLRIVSAGYFFYA
jgi:hypothetical protein